SIFTQTYQGIDSKNIPKGTTLEQLRDRILADFVKRMFSRREPISPQKQQKMIAWLAFLAKRLYQQQKLIFGLKDLQLNGLDWLPIQERSQVDFVHLLDNSNEAASWPLKPSRIFCMSSFLHDTEKIPVQAHITKLVSWLSQLQMDKVYLSTD